MTKLMASSMADLNAKSDLCAESARAGVKRKRCGHCDELLTVPVYKRHKRLYYDSDNKRWNRPESSGEESAEESTVDFVSQAGNIAKYCKVLHCFIINYRWQQP